MPSVDYNENDATSNPQSDDVEEEDEEEESEDTHDLNSPSASGKVEGDEDQEDYDALDDTPASKPFLSTIKLMLPQVSSAKRVHDLTTVRVCLTRGVIDHLANREARDRNGEMEDDIASSAAASTKKSGVASEADEDDDATAAAQLQGCCAADHHYESDYAAALSAVRRRLILRRLHGDAERQRRFLLAERAREQRAQKSLNDNDADDAAGNEGEAAVHVDPLEDVVWPWTTTQQPPPYWLPALLANDVSTFQRIIQVMYGWIIAPDPHPSDQLRLNAAGQLCCGRDDVKNPADEDEDIEQTDPAQHTPDFFLASGAFRGEEDDEAHEANTVSSNEGSAAHGTQLASKSLLVDFNECETHPERLSDGDGPHQQQQDPASPNAQSRSRVMLSIGTAPPPVASLPYFPFTEYEFFIAYDTSSGEWHLLDTHPLMVTQACRQHQAALLDGVEHEDEQKEEDVALSDEEAAEDARSEDQDAGNQQKKKSGTFHVPTYALDTIIPVSPVILAALFSPAALRCCLLQPLQTAPRDNGDGDAEDTDDQGEEIDGSKLGTVKRGVSPQAVLRTLDEAWLSADLFVALPILTTVCRARQHVLQQDALRIPYNLGNLWIDVNPLFQLPRFRDVVHPASREEVRRWRASPGRNAEDDDDGEDCDGAGIESLSETQDIPAPHSWGVALDNLVDASNYGRLVLSSLLDSGVLPTRPVELSIFQHLSLLRLALWWWLRLPPKVLQQWGDDGGADDGPQEDAEAEDEEEEGSSFDELAGMTVEEVLEVLLQRIAARKQREVTARRRLLQEQHPVLVFAPLLKRVLLELQRRLNRLYSVDARGVGMTPSQYSLQESVERTYAADRLESGHKRQDPLVTAGFVGLADVIAEEDGDCASRTPAVAVRHLRLFQSDLVLLLLALTTTPAPLPACVATWMGSAKQRYNSLAEEHIFQKEDTVVNVKVAQAGDADGHVILFEKLLDAKSFRYVRRPQDRIRSCTLKMLLLCAVDFCRGAVRLCLFERLPRFELFGSTGYCPLPELFDSWASTFRSEAGTRREATVKLFAYYTWNEIRWRLRKGQYSSTVIAQMRYQLPELFVLVDAHTEQYNAILTHFAEEATAESAGDLTIDAQEKLLEDPPSSLTASLRSAKKQFSGTARASANASIRRRPSLFSSAVLTATRKEERDAFDHLPTPAFMVPAPPSSCADGSVRHPLTMAHPNAYSADVIESKARVNALWQSFHVEPSTYMTAETLHALLFGSAGDARAEQQELEASTMVHPRRFHIAALRVMFENGITQVQPCPLDGPEAAAIEVALQRADLAVVKVLLGLGAASLEDVRLNGSTTLESWAEELFSPTDMHLLRFAARKNKWVACADPHLQFGARRFAKGRGAETLVEEQ